MEQDNSKRPSAALINREWFEAAGNVLSREELAWVCLHAVEYVLYGKDIPGKGSGVGMVFAMIKPALDSDVMKYQERCARNAANAKKGAQRMGASGSDSQRVGAISTTTTTTTTATTPSLSPESRPEEIEREKFLIAGYFFSKGNELPVEEMNAFWSYYESLGWRNNKGAAIMNKMAAARMWKCRYATGEEKFGSSVWFDIWSRSECRDLDIWALFRCVVIESDNVIRLRFKSAASIVPTLKEHYMPILGAIAAKFGATTVNFSD